MWRGGDHSPARSGACGSRGSDPLLLSSPGGSENICVVVSIIRRKPGSVLQFNFPINKVHSQTQKKKNEKDLFDEQGLGQLFMTEPRVS